MNVTQIQQLSDLLRQAAEAHQRTVRRGRPDDPEWPLWYAQYLHPRVKPYLTGSLSRSDLVFWLINTEKGGVVADWPTVFAIRLLEEYGGSAPRP